MRANEVLSKITTFSHPLERTNGFQSTLTKTQSSIVRWSGVLPVLCGLTTAAIARAHGALLQVVPVTVVGAPKNSRQDAAPTDGTAERPGAVWPGLFNVFQDAVEFVEVVVADDQLP
jgi:hypothetical protein